MDVNKILNCDWIEGLRSIPDNSINCCVTSPPYWGLRDYGVEGQLGLEKTPELYVEKIVAGFREVKRVLRNDGTLWLNLGDSYWGGKGQSAQAWSTEHQNRNTINKSQHQISGKKETRPQDGKHEVIKSKDLVGIPWMVAFALRADGWYLRQDIIWHKPNPMPESVTDRCTKSHEYIFLLSKSAKYYYDRDSISEEVSGTSHRRGSIKTPDGWDTSKGSHGSFHKNGREKGHKNSWNGSEFHTGKTMEHQLGRAQKERGVHPKSADPGSGIKSNTSFSSAIWDLVEKRNKRSVWTIPTFPMPEAHFATFPPELIVDCIKAGCPEGGIVLDPFMGAGTTALVSRKLNRNYIGIELNDKYIAISEKRLHAELGLFQ